MLKPVRASRTHPVAGSGVQRRCRCRRVLRSIEAELEELREQNRLLHESAGFFAELSERLNVQLRRQRSMAPGPTAVPSAVRTEVINARPDNFPFLSRSKSREI
jgi:hypothetical protein